MAGLPENLLQAFKQGASISDRGAKASTSSSSSSSDASNGGDLNNNIALVLQEKTIETKASISSSSIVAITADFWTGLWRFIIVITLKIINQSADDVADDNVALCINYNEKQKQQLCIFCCFEIIFVTFYYCIMVIFERCLFLLLTTIFT